MTNQISEERLNELYEKERQLNTMKVNAQEARLRREARIKLILQKAQEAGISVSEKEVEQFLKTKKTK